jgi:C4-type Zn-finger protein
MESLSQDILQAAQIAVGASIKEVLTKYDSPLVRLTRIVVEENAAELKTLISDSFTAVIRTEEFKQSIVNAFSHKVARTIISNNDGLFDKVSNDLKQDQTFKAKMTLAVASVVEECLKDRKP